MKNSCVIWQSQPQVFSAWSTGNTRGEIPRKQPAEGPADDWRWQQQGLQHSLAEAPAATQSGGLCKLWAPWFSPPVYPKGRVGLEPRNPCKNLLGPICCQVYVSLSSTHLPQVQGTHRAGPLGQCAWLLAKVGDAGLLTLSS